MFTKFTGNNGYNQEAEASVRAINAWSAGKITLVGKNKVTRPQLFALISKMDLAIEVKNELVKLTPKKFGKLIWQFFEEAYEWHHVKMSGSIFAEVGFYDLETFEEQIKEMEETDAKIDGMSFLELVKSLNDKKCNYCLNREKNVLGLNDLANSLFKKDACLKCKKALANI